MKKRKDEIDVLVERFRNETDKIALPSADDLLQMIEKVDASQHRGAPFVPVRRQRRAGWRYAAAAAVVVLVAVSVVLLLPASPSVPQTASADSVDAIADTGCIDSVAPVLATPTDVQRRTRIAALPRTEPATRDSAIQHPASVSPPTVSTPETEQAREVMAFDEQPQPDETAPERNDSVRTPAEPLDGVEKYPERPTIKETENLIEKENNRRALQNRKERKPKRDKKTEKHGFIEKKDAKEDKNIIIPEPNRPHYHPMMQNGRIIYYYL